ncbi:GNAT family N-acetyltransferase [Seonamhaeicola sp.]|uniref:GNAT family N-acetyltransferase n=1 Tax=Seonamhaeicola sp. TaxID=1912245 RepID=UPI002636E0D7|nr:GNAT family N-acetyltransferase [Seonamhaeicola sp.]
MPQIKRYQFLWNYFKRSQGIIPDCYANLYFNDKTFSNKRSRNQLDAVNYISLFPNFFRAELTKEAYKLIKVPHYGMDGLGILLNKDYTYDSYKNEHIKKSFLKGFRRSLRRLETCLNIRYEYNYGSISEEKLKLILSHLYTMLNVRFKEKDTNSVFMDEWDINTENLKQLIEQKRSSLFVVYHNDDPISISINRHVNNDIFLSECHAYDTDFSKFGLGHIDNYMLLNWSIDNKVYFLDLGLGSASYKNKWCNFDYNLEYQIYYKKGMISARLVANFEALKIHIKNRIKKLKLDEAASRLKKRSPNDKPVAYTTEAISLDEAVRKTKSLNCLNNYESGKLTRRMVVDFVYTYEEHLDKVSAFKVHENLFVIKGEKKAIEIKF